jgi:hypothetical protein
MIKAPISADTLKLVQARRALEAEKAAEKARAKEAKKKPLETKVSLEEPSDASKAPSKKRYIAHQIDTPADLLLAHRPDLQLYKWQAETLFQLAGYTDINDLDLPKTRPTDKMPLYYNLVAANGSGKDQVVISAFAVWFCLSKVRSRCVITSSSYEQLKDQTYKYIKNICEEINVSYGRKVFEIVEFLITCNDTGSEIKCFVTDDPGKAEGRHPFDEAGAEMAVIINEAKSITDEMFQAFSRFTGYNYWLEISWANTSSILRTNMENNPSSIEVKYWLNLHHSMKPPSYPQHSSKTTQTFHLVRLDCPIERASTYHSAATKLWRTSLSMENSTYEQQSFVTRQFSTIRSSVGLKNLTSRPLTYSLMMAVWGVLLCSECKMQVMTSCQYETKPAQVTRISTKTEALKTGIVLSVLLKIVSFLSFTTILLVSSSARAAFRSRVLSRF